MGHKTLTVALLVWLLFLRVSVTKPLCVCDWQARIRALEMLSEGCHSVINSTLASYFSDKLVYWDFPVGVDGLWVGWVAGRWYRRGGVVVMGMGCRVWDWTDPKLWNEWNISLFIMTDGSIRPFVFFFILILMTFSLSPPPPPQWPVTHSAYWAFKLLESCAVKVDIIIIIIIIMSAWLVWVAVLGAKGEMIYILHLLSEPEFYLRLQWRWNLGGGCRLSSSVLCAFSSWCLPFIVEMSWWTQLVRSFWWPDPNSGCFSLL